MLLVTRRAFMTEPAKIFPIPCRKCGKLALFPITSGTHSLGCLACRAVTEVLVRPVGPGWEIRTALAALKPRVTRKKLGPK